MCAHAEQQSPFALAQAGAQGPSMLTLQGLGPRFRASACTHVGTRTRMQRERCEERCHSVPSPLAGEGQGGGYHCASVSRLTSTNESELSLSNRMHWPKARCSSPPLSLSLPRKGGGNRVARTFATLLPRTLRCVHALALPRGRTECVPQLRECWSAVARAFATHATRLRRFSN